jgi:hypothetical protein
MGRVSGGISLNKNAARHLHGTPCSASANRSAENPRTAERIGRAGMDLCPRDKTRHLRGSCEKFSARSMIDLRAGLFTVACHYHASPYNFGPYPIG